MSNAFEPHSQDRAGLGEYCRQVEEHLTRVNGGHLVRVVGSAFELVRSWAQSGVPLSVVFFGIDRKAERHRAGASSRPLRLEFCEADVRAAHDRWRRAIGIGGTESAMGRPSESAMSRRRPSLAKQLDRAFDRMTRAAGRLGTPDDLRNAIPPLLESLAGLREEARGARGGARDVVLAQMRELDGQIGAAARATPDRELEKVRDQAVLELSAYRSRLGPEAWQRSVDLSVDRLLRERFGLPTLDPDEF